MNEVPIVSSAVLVLALLVGCQGEPESSTSISGISMAPLLMGGHSKVTCDQCEYEIIFASDRIPQSETLVCPNCGHKDISVDAATNCEADKVYVQPLNRGDKIERWEVVAFLNPESNEFSVKRIIGLPGETIECFDGNVYANGELIRKTPGSSVQIELWNHVYEFGHWTSLMPDRFRTLDSDIYWYKGQNQLKFDPVEATGEIEWIWYQHKHCYRNAASKGEKSLINDSYAINQNVSRSPNPIADIRYRFDLITPDGVEVFIRIHDGQSYHLLKLDSEADHFLVVDGEPIDVDLGERERKRAWSDIEVSVDLFDDQMSVSMNGIEVYKKLLVVGKPHLPVANPIMFGGKSKAFEIGSLEICRDVFYFAGERATKTKWTLGPGEYFVVGDNVPASRDSRHWNKPGLERRRIIGRVRKNDSIIP